LRLDVFEEVCGSIAIDGDGAKLLELRSRFDTLSPMFELVEPKQSCP
jgi:hypothetical protein